MKKVVDFLTANSVFQFATIEGDRPRVRPFGFFMVEQGRMYFTTGEGKKVANQLRANPKFELSAVNNKGEWLRVSATAVFDTRPELVEKAFRMMPMLKDIYGNADKGGPRIAMFYADKAEAVLADMQGRNEVVTF